MFVFFTKESVLVSSLIAIQHWGLLLTGSTPPTGKFYHATDEGRNALDLVRESYPTDSGMLQSRMVVVALYIGQVSEARLEWASQDAITHLMERRHLPRGEPQWTCRVWVKTVLAKVAQDNQSKTLTKDLGKFAAMHLAMGSQVDMEVADARNSSQN